MPIITLQYTENIIDGVNFNQLFSELHQTLHQLCGVNIENCKSRAIGLEQYFVGVGGTEKAYVHLEVLLLAGRALEIKQKMGNALLELLKRYYSKSMQQLNLQITVKMGDIEKETYFKYPEGTFTP